MSLTDDDWSMVRACELFRGMPDRVVRDLLSGRAPMPLHEGQILFHQGDPAVAFSSCSRGG